MSRQPRLVLPANRSTSFNAVTTAESRSFPMRTINGIGSRCTRHSLALLALCIAFVAAGSEPITSAEGRAFFKKYIALSDAYNAEVAELYADDSRIKAFRRYPHGLERSMEFDGRKWKGLLRAAMPLAKATGDRSEFRKITVEPVGDLIRIRAERYSLRKCYLDRGYYMVIGRQADGALKIVEEYLETQPNSDC